MEAPRLLAGAAAVALCLGGAAVSTAGLAGARSGWADVANNFAPIALLSAAIGGLLSWVGLEPGVVRTTTLGLALIGALAGLARIAPEMARLRPGARPGARAFRVLTANVCERNPIPDQAIAAILARDADAVILQEAGSAFARLIPPLRLRYPHLAEYPGAGLRIFTKSPIIAEHRGAGLASSSRGRLLAVSILSDGLAITLATTHFSHPYPERLQVAERQALAAEISALDARNLILAGDFNTTPWSDGMRCQDALLGGLQRRTIAWFTWPARLQRFAVPWPLPVLPIDHVYSGPGWGAARLTRVRIPGSDHFATEVALTRSRAS